jgi:hypothetical protein
MNDDLPRLVECAKFFHHHKPAVTGAVPTSFANEDEARAWLHNSLLVEAHHAMQEGSDAVPDKLLSNAIDLDSSEPGIAVRNGLKIETLRSDDVVREVRYERRVVAPAEDRSVEPPKLAPRRVAKLVESSRRALQKAHERAEQKAEESLMTREERRELNRQRKEARERKRAEREEAAPEEAPRAEEEEAPDVEGEAEEGADDEESKEEEEEVPKPKCDPLEAVYCVPALGEALPSAAKKRKPGEVTLFHSSPAPHDRYLTALASSGLHDALRDTILTGTPASNPHLVIVHGPPGTGKSHTLLDALESYIAQHPGARCLVAAPTNIAAADLYTRAFERNLVGCLALAKESMPPGVPKPRKIELSTSRIVFATIAGRSGRLDDEVFHAVFLDEAGMAPENVCWGLLRPQVRFLMLVGDLKQLGAPTSGAQPGAERSLMERLCALGVDSTTLTTQRRMHPEILDYPSRAFYDGALRTADDRVPSEWRGRPYEVKDVRGQTEVVQTSYENVVEARACVDEALRLRGEGFDHVVILVPYAAQLRRVRSLRAGVEAYTLDSFQGREADAVVLGIVRTDAPGFWADARRLTVALTRAKHALVVVGHGAWATTDKDTPLGGLFADAAARGVLVV